MKLRNLKKTNQRFASSKFQILKLCSKKKKFDSKTSLKLTETLLNKIANIINEYHLSRKKILFLGFPSHFSEVLKNTKHLLVPKFMWSNGMLSNNISFSSNHRKKTTVPINMIKLALKLKKKADLIIIYDLNDNINAIKESSALARIPIITINKTHEINLGKSIYELTGNYDFLIERKKNANIFFSIIKSIILRANKKKGSLTYLTWVRKKEKEEEKKKLYFTKSRYGGTSSFKRKNRKFSRQF